MFAVGVLFSSNVVRMAAYLIVSLAATAGLFMLAGAEFVGAMQIMIYVGGTLVLLIFGVMLTAQATFVSMKTSSGRMDHGGDCRWIVAVLAGASGGSVSSDWQLARRINDNVAAADTKTCHAAGAGVCWAFGSTSQAQPDELAAAGHVGILAAV